MDDWDRDYRGVNLFGALVGKTISEIDINKDLDEIKLSVDGQLYRMHHYQDCCENVEINEIIGDLDDLIGAPLLIAEVVESEEPPEGFRHEYEPESQTWTFYKLATVKGHVTLRWFGTSNGYYSEAVVFEKVDP